MERILTFVYLGIALWILVLLVRAKKLKVPEGAKDEDSSSIQKAFRRAGLLLVRTLEKAGKKRLIDRKVLEDLNTLEPGKDPARGERYYAEKIGNVLMLLLLAALLSLIVLVKSGNNSRIQTAEDGTQYIERTKETDTVELNAGAGDTKAGTWSVEVLPGTYTKEELDALEKEAAKELQSAILCANQDLQHVNTRLTFVSKLPDYPFDLSYDSLDSALIDRDGTVFADEVPDGQTRNVTIRCFLTCQDEEYVEEIEVTVIPKERSKEEAFLHHIGEALLDSSADTTDEKLVLPGRVDGVTLTWSEKKKDRSIQILVLFSIIGIALYFIADSRLHEKIEEREKQMVRDYPQIVSCFVLYLGAGMSVRNVFFRLAAQYEEKRQAGGEKRYAYEEIGLLCRELSLGVSDVTALSHFAIRCRQKNYTRFGMLLSQNLRKGNSALLTSLMREAEDAFESRKMSARLAGEEAGARLLVPMILMLVVVMVIIMVPAFSGFNL